MSPARYPIGTQPACANSAWLPTTSVTCFCSHQKKQCACSAARGGSSVCPVCAQVLALVNRGPNLGKDGLRSFGVVRARHLAGRMRSLEDIGLDSVKPATSSSGLGLGDMHGGFYPIFQGPLKTSHGEGCVLLYSTPVQPVQCRCRGVSVCARAYVGVSRELNVRDDARRS